MTKQDRERLFGDPSLFGGWTEADILSAIRRTFFSRGSKTTMILRPEFKSPKVLPALKKRWAAGIWSFGYCFYIAEAAQLMFRSAFPGKNFGLKSFKSKKKVGGRLPPELKKHYTLFYKDLCFDPEAGAAVPQNEYPGGKGERFRLPPSMNALLLLAWIAQDSDKINTPARTSLARLQPALSEIASRWTTGGPKAKLKEEVRRLAGLSG
ncbi:MAG: hypothetical protein ACREIC_30845 [Limisphaerales bacterium]